MGALTLFGPHFIRVRLKRYLMTPYVSTSGPTVAPRIRVRPKLMRCLKMLLQPFAAA